MEPDRVRQRQEELDGREAELKARENELARREQQIARQESQIQEHCEELKELIGSLHREKVKMLEDNEETIVSFCLSITRKVIQHEIENGRYKMDRVIKGALDAVGNQGKTVVKVNPADHDIARQCLEEAGPGTSSDRVSVVADPQVLPAACCIETESGKIYSDVEGRLDRIEEGLLKKAKENDVL